MIDKINGKGTYEYQSGPEKRKNPALKAYENTPGAKKPTKGKAESKQGGHAGVQDKAAQGVILDLSPKAAEKKQSSTVKERVAFFRTALQKLFAPVAKWLKNFWESDAPEKAAGKEADATVAKDAENAADAVVAESMENAADMEQTLPMDESMVYDLLQSGQAHEIELPPLDEEVGPPDYQAAVDEALKARDMHQLGLLLTKNGAKQPARNSDLLTYYDRRGRIVELDETERYRVLFGDKNVMRL